MSEQDVHYFIMTLSYCSDQSCLSKVILCETRQLIQSAKFTNAPLNSDQHKTKLEVTYSLRMKVVEGV